MAKVKNIFSLQALPNHLTKACLKQQVYYDKDKRDYFLTRNDIVFSVLTVADKDI